MPKHVIKKFVPLPKSPTFNMRGGALKVLPEVLFDIRQDVNVMTAPSRKYRKNCFDKKLQAKGKFKKVTIW